MKKWRRCTATLNLEGMPFDSFYCELPDDGHTQHTTEGIQDGQDWWIIWVDKDLSS